MRLEILQQLLEINKCGSISKAASELFISRSALSMSISQLEEELNVSLFVRNYDGVVPTMAGKEILMYAQQITDIMDKIHCVSRDHLPINSELSGFITLGLKEKFINDILNNTIFETNNKYPNISLNVINMDTKTCIQQVQNGQIAFGLISFPEENKQTLLHLLKEQQLVFEALPSDQVYLIVNHNNLLASHSSISIEEVYNYKFVTFDNIAKTFLEMNTIEGDMYFKNKNNITYMPNLDSSLNIVREKSSYFTLMPYTSMLKNEQTLYEESLCAIPIKNSQQYNYIIYASSFELAEYSRFFIDTYKYKFQQLF